MGYYVGIKGKRLPFRTLNSARRFIMENDMEGMIAKNKTGHEIHGTVLKNIPKGRYEWYTPSLNYYLLNKDGSIGRRV